MNIIDVKKSKETENFVQIVYWLFYLVNLQKADNKKYFTRTAHNVLKPENNKYCASLLK